MSRPRILDLFSGAGGAAVGYHRAGFDVVGVDAKPQPSYPFDFHQADALEFLSARGGEFDAIHASPPCQAYVPIAAIHAKRNCRQHPRLIGPVRDLLQRLDVPWIIENVVGAPLRHPVLVCGSAFGLRVRRHRWFESSCTLFSSYCRHTRQGRAVGVYGHQGSGALRKREHGGAFIRAKDRHDAGDAMGIDWMTWRELTQAIPPAYSEFLGRQLMRHLRHREARA